MRRLNHQLRQHKERFLPLSRPVWKLESFAAQGTPWRKTLKSEQVIYPGKT
jgi:hypothetical protein